MAPDWSVTGAKVQRASPAAWPKVQSVQLVMGFLESRERLPNESLRPFGAGLLRRGGATFRRASAPAEFRARAARRSAPAARATPRWSPRAGCTDRAEARCGSPP